MSNASSGGTPRPTYNLEQGLATTPLTAAAHATEIARLFAVGPVPPGRD